MSTTANVIKSVNRFEFRPDNEYQQEAGIGTTGQIGLVGGQSEQTSDIVIHDRYLAKTWPAGVDLNICAGFYKAHPEVYIAVRRIVSAVTGRGWEIVQDPSYSGTVEEGEVQRATEFFHSLSADKTFMSELRRTLTDYVLLGNGAMEIVRNVATGLPSAAYHMHATEVRCRINNDGFVQRTASGRYQIFNRYTPRAEDRLALQGRGLWHRMLDQDGGYSTTNPYASEIVFLNTPNPDSRYYGLPPVMVAAKDILLDNSAKDSNIAFFQNGMLLEFAVVVNGGSLDEASLQNLASWLQQAHGGPHNHHGILYLSAMAETGEQVKIELQPVKSPHKDMAWKDLTEACRDKILRVFGLSPAKTGVSNDGQLSGGSSAQVDVDSFKSEVVSPIQTEVEHVFTRMVKLDGGFPGLLWRFDEADKREERQNVEIASRAVGGAAVISVNEARAMMGYPKKDAKNGVDYDDIPQTAQANGLRTDDQATRKPNDQRRAGKSPS